MNFHVYRCLRDRDTFFVTNDDHLDAVTDEICPTPGDALQKVGVFSEIGRDRVAFNETLAKNSIENQGYYRFEAKTFNPVAEWPLAMP